MTTTTTDTVTIDQWLEAGRGGMTDARLDEVFDLVKPAENWKLPIEAKVKIGAATPDEISRAVIWFAGCVPTVEPIFNGNDHEVDGIAPGGQTGWWVEAEGYYSAVGA